MKYTYFNFKKWNDQQILLTNDLGAMGVCITSDLSSDAAAQT